MAPIIETSKVVPGGGRTGDGKLLRRRGTDRGIAADCQFTSLFRGPAGVTKRQRFCAFPPLVIALLMCHMGSRSSPAALSGPPRRFPQGFP
jgi:hypothetical protein